MFLVLMYVLVRQRECCGTVAVEVGSCKQVVVSYVEGVVQRQAGDNLKGRIRDSNPIQGISPHGPLAVHSVCSLKKTPVFFIQS